TDRADCVFEFFRRFLASRAAVERERGAQVNTLMLQESSWNCWTNQESDPYPLQGDLHSCGLIACRVLEVLLAGKDPTWQQCSMQSPIFSPAAALLMRQTLFTVVSGCLGPRRGQATS
ncbi:hypothetical protein V8E36_002782, partial [Tilletia maclaganii]